MRSPLVIKSLPFVAICLVAGWLGIAGPAAAAIPHASAPHRTAPRAAVTHLAAPHDTAGPHGTAAPQDTAGPQGSGPARDTVSVGAVRAGRRTVTFDGVSVRVPAAWRVVNLARHPRACPRLDVHAVYLGSPGPAPDCPAELHRGRTAAVQLTRVSPASPDLRLATRHAVIAGRAILTNPDAAVSRQITDIVPSAGVQVTLSYGTSAAAARSVEKSIRVGPRARPMRITASASPPPAPAQGVVTGPGFDTCAAPSMATMKAWLASPYRSVGIYIGGVNRACAQASLTASWVRAVQAEGWHYFPLYVGLQAPCVAGFGNAVISAGSAAAQGKAAADDAAVQAASLGIPAATPLIFDMEAYRGGCSQPVLTFLSAWDTELHTRGYAAGVYESFSNIGDLAGAAGQVTEPDLIHYADWDGKATTASSYMPSAAWASHQRIHQYRGGHNETWGGVTVNVDNDQLDANLGLGPVSPPPGSPAPPPSPSPSPSPRPTPTPTPVPTPSPTPIPTSQPAPTPTSTPAPPVAPLRPGFRIAVAMNANGTAEWFAHAADGTLTHNYQHPIGTADWWGSRAVGDSPAGLAGNPAVTVNAGGTLALFARTASGQIVHAWQEPGAPNGWHWAGPIGSLGTGTAGAASPAGTAGPAKVTGPAVADPGAIRAPDGKVTVFTATADGTVLTARQERPGAASPWTGWTAIGGSCASPPVPFAARLGPLQVFCVTRSGTLAVAALRSAGWGDWQAAGHGPAGMTGSPAVIAGPGGQTQVLVTAAGKLAWGTQDPAAGSWAWGASPAGRTTVRNSPAVTAWPGGAIAVFARQRNGKLGYAVLRSGPGAAGWGLWTVIGGHALGSPAAWMDAGGTMEVAFLDRRLHIAVSTFRTGTWTPFTEIGAGF